MQTSAMLVSTSTQSERPVSEFHNNEAHKKGLWEHYRHTANVHDQERNQKWVESMDTILVFSGLFAAFLATFITESTSELEMDTQEATYKILLHISQQLANSSTPAYTPSLFTPAGSAVVASNLYVTSLGLVLMASFFAILIKRWTRDFSRGLEFLNDHKEWALFRQACYSSLEYMKFPFIVRNLSVLLYFALATMLTGLTIQFYYKSWSAAVFVAGSLLLCLLFLTGTYILGILNPYSPFYPRLGLSANVQSWTWFIDRIFSQGKQGELYSQGRLRTFALEYLAQNTPLSDSNNEIIHEIVQYADTDPHTLGWTRTDVIHTPSETTARMLAVIGHDLTPVVVGYIKAALQHGDQWDQAVCHILTYVYVRPESHISPKRSLTSWFALGVASNTNNNDNRTKIVSDSIMHEFEAVFSEPTAWMISTHALDGIRRVLSTAVKQEHIHFLFEFAIIVLDKLRTPSTLEQRQALVTTCLSSVMRFHTILCTRPKQLEDLNISVHELQLDHLLAFYQSTILECQACCPSKVHQILRFKLFHLAIKGLPDYLNTTVRNVLLPKGEGLHSFEEGTLLLDEFQMKIGLSPVHAFDALLRFLGLPIVNDQVARKTSVSKHQLHYIARWMYTYDEQQKVYDLDFLKHLDQTYIRFERIDPTELKPFREIPFHNPWLEFHLHTILRVKRSDFHILEKLGPTLTDYAEIVKIRLAYYRDDEIPLDEGVVRACSGVSGCEKHILELLCKRNIPIDPKVYIGLFKDMLGDKSSKPKPEDMLPGWMFLSRELIKLSITAEASQDVIQNLCSTFLDPFNGLEWLERFVQLSVKDVETWKLVNQEDYGRYVKAKGSAAIVTPKLLKKTLDHIIQLARINLKPPFNQSEVLESVPSMFQRAVDFIWSQSVESTMLRRSDFKVKYPNLTTCLEKFESDPDEEVHNLDLPSHPKNTTSVLPSHTYRHSSGGEI